MKMLARTILEIGMMILPLVTTVFAEGEAKESQSLIQLIIAGKVDRKSVV